MTLKTIAMMDEHNEFTRVKLEERFTKLESQVLDIFGNAMILMVALESKFTFCGVWQH